MSVPDLLPGCATREGTRRYADRFPDLPGHFRCPDELWLSSLGLGTRAGEPGGADDLLYRESVAVALEGGINVLDTALSYRLQSSERAVGAALRRALAEGKVARDEVVVCTKGGYLTVDPDFARTRFEARQYLTDTYVRSGLVSPEALVGGSHSLEPAFLEDQIRRSRRNLGLETLDLYLLQDPELHLEAKGATEFADVLAAAFETLEKAVARRHIGAYGLSTWSGLLLPHLERGHLSVMDVLDAALVVGGPDHHLRALQLPYGLGMAEAGALPSQLGPDVRTAAVLEVLRDTGTAVFTAAPLGRGRTARGLPPLLAELFPETRTDAQRCLQFVRSTPGVSCALVGMRRADHVRESLALASHPPADAARIDALFARVRAEAG